MYMTNQQHKRCSRNDGSCETVWGTTILGSAIYGSRTFPLTDLGNGQASLDAVKFFSGRGPFSLRLTIWGVCNLSMQPF